MISVIVPVYRNSVLLEYCLDRAMRCLPTGSEVVVVDDYSGAETRAVCKKFPQVRLVEHDSNRGNTVAYNTGAQASSGSLLVFMDSDVLIQPETIEALKSAYHSTPNPGAIGALLLYPQSYTVQHAGVAFDRWVLSHLFTGREVTELKLEKVEERQAVTAALFMCSKATYNSVGGFDQTYRDGLEDIDFCLKCRERGLINAVATEALAMHLESATRGPYKHVRRTYNYSIFFSRWAGRYTPDLSLYLDRGLRDASYSPTPGTEATLVNFCTTPNWIDLARPLQEHGVTLLNMHDLSGFQAEGEAIDLYRCLPLALHKRTEPLLFLVDHFSQLSQNRHWFSQRQSPDIVIDRHANVLPNFIKRIS